MKERITYFDILRGLAIIGVVAIHSAGIGYQFQDTSIQFIGTVIWRQLINFSVPLFLAISGYFLAKKIVENKKDYFSFIRKQIPRVLIPYILWSILYLGINMIRGAELQSILFKFFTFQSAVPFYFIILIIQYYLLLPVMKKLATSKGLIISTTISIASCLIIFYFRYYTNFDLPLFVYAGVFPTWMIFFVLGIYIKLHGIALKKRILNLFVLLGVIISCIETYFLYSKFHNIGDSITAIKISSFLYSIAIILFLFKKIKIKPNHSKILIFIGKISFGIYLSHIFFLGGINTIINKFLPFLNSYAMLKQMILISLTISCCVLFAFVTRKLNKKYAIKYLGQ